MKPPLFNTIEWERDQEAQDKADRVDYLTAIVLGYFNRAVTIEMRFGWNWQTACAWGKYREQLLRLGAAMNDALGVPVPVLVVVEDAA
jgi:hypothetical protein